MEKDHNEEVQKRLEELRRKKEYEVSAGKPANINERNRHMIRLSLAEIDEAIMIWQEPGWMRHWSKFYAIINGVGSWARYSNISIA